MLVLLGVGSAAASTTALAAQGSVLDGYVAEGLRRNLGLEADRQNLDRAEALLREARGRWLPSLDLNARYSERSGSILDIGELVNPAFRALNQLMGRQAFPTDLSLKQPYKQETGLRLSQPLFLPAASAGVAIAGARRDQQAAEIAVAARSLAARIRLAYLELARATRVEELAGATLELLEENLRVTESLVRNGVATPDAVLRARADRSEARQQLDEARQRRESAEEAFNLLLERPLEQPVPLAPDSLLGLGLSLSRDSAVAAGLSRREEIRQLDAVQAADQGQERLARAGFLPTLSAAIDYGVQGDRYRFGGDQDYLIASVVLSWNLFRGGQDRARVQQARVAQEQVRLSQEELRRRIGLEIRSAWRAADVAGAARATARDRLASASRSYELVERKYRAGEAAAIELTDARTSYTAARLNLILTTYDYYARCVELDRATAEYPGPDVR